MTDVPSSDTRTAFGFFCVLTLALCLAPTVRAQDATGEGTTAPTPEQVEEGRRHFRLGQAHYDNGEYHEAAAEFEEAYRLSRRTELLYNVYVAHRDAGEVAEAASALRRYLEATPDAENAAQLRARLAAMDRTLASTGGTGPGGTGTGGTAAGGTETGGTGTGGTGTGGSETADTSGSSAGEGAAIGAAHSDTGGGGFGSSPVGWIVSGVGLAMVGVGIGTGVAALDSQSRLDAMCGPRFDACPAGFEGERSNGQSLALATDVLVIGGSVVTVTGVVLLFVLTDGGSPPPVTAACTADGCMASISGGF